MIGDGNDFKKNELLIIMNSDRSLFASTSHSSLDLIDCNNSATTDHHIDRRQDATDDEDCAPLRGAINTLNTVRWKKSSRRIQWTEQLVRDLQFLYQESESKGGKYVDRLQCLWAKSHPDLPAT